MKIILKLLKIKKIKKKVNKMKNNKRIKFKIINKIYKMNKN